MTEKERSRHTVLKVVPYATAYIKVTTHNRYHNSQAFFADKKDFRGSIISTGVLSLEGLNTIISTGVLSLEGLNTINILITSRLRRLEKLASSALRQTGKFLIFGMLHT